MNKNKLHNLPDMILHTIKSIDTARGEYQSLLENAEIQAKNQYLFFTKPELIRDIPEPAVEKIFSLILNKIHDFNFHIQSVFALTGKYLEEFNIIARHYGVIDKVARDPLPCLTDQALANFRKIYGKDASDCTILGSFDYMKTKGISIGELTMRWLSKYYDKLAGGVYSIYLEADDVYLFNGFYPQMLNHFTREDSIYFCFILTGNQNWKSMRGDFSGATDPARAKQGSIRNVLFINKKEFGLDEVSSNFNGVHLSAGPVEALAELRRFSSNLTKTANERPVTDFMFGKKLAGNFNAEEIKEFLNNSMIISGNATVSIFDLTEEMNSDEAIVKLKGIQVNPADKHSC